MARLLNILLLFFLVQSLYSQNDSTIIVKKNFLLFGKDTINVTDSSGLKQGVWIEYNRLKTILIPIERQDSMGNYLEDDIWIEDTIIEPENYKITFKGEYLNNLKTGDWYAYYKNGTLWKKCTFCEGKPIGSFVFYYSNSNPKMVGIQIDRNSFNVLKISKEGCLIDNQFLDIEIINSLLN